MQEDTIAAISTPIGEGAISIIRLSGPESISIVNGIFKTPDNHGLIEAASHTIHYGHIVDPEDNSIIDEVLVNIMRAPRTYTREDIVEINGHGGGVPLRRILELVMRGGCRLAEPGEFTKKAFLNGRIDLAQAEAVIDIIRAKTDLGSRVALSHLKGSLSKEIEEIGDEIIDIVAAIEVAIDFPEDDLEDVDISNITDDLLGISKRLSHLLDTADSGRILRQGLKTAIIGKPNVGKSSLLNLILRESRAIVTEIPGTTRDIIQETVNIKDVPLILLDTAGLRETGELVERLGIERTLEALEEAELILYVVDSSTELTSEDHDILDRSVNKDVIVVLNKIDLPSITTKETIRDLLKEKGRDLPIVQISAKNRSGLEDLERVILEEVFKGKSLSGAQDLIMLNVRQKDLLERGIKRLNEGLDGIERGLPADIIALELKAVGRILSEITGKFIDEEIIDRIFSQFCVGK